MPDHLITSDPGGRPVIAGTHVTVEEVLKELAASEAVDVIPRTEFGRELWELRKKAMEELRVHNEPLLDLEGIRREVRERRGERHFGVDR